VRRNGKFFLDLHRGSLRRSALNWIAQPLDSFSSSTALQLESYGNGKMTRLEFGSNALRLESVLAWSEIFKDYCLCQA